MLWAHIVDLERQDREVLPPCITKDLVDISWLPTMLHKSRSSGMNRSSRHCTCAQSMALILVSLRPGNCWRSFPKKRSILLSVSSNWLVFLCPIMIDYLPPTPFVDSIRERIWPFCGDPLGICAH